MSSNCALRSNKSANTEPQLDAAASPRMLRPACFQRYMAQPDWSTMSDAAKIVWGAIGAVGVYVIGQLLSKFFIEPLHELRKAVGEVRFNLSFHASTIHTPIVRSEKTSEAAREALMKSSCDLIAKLHAVPAYEATRVLAIGALPPRTSIEKAAVQLRGLSTYVHETGDKAVESLEVIRKRVALIERELRLNPLE